MKIVACVVVLCGFSAVFAENGEAPAPRTVARTSEQRGMDTLISLTLPEMDLAQALQLVADEAGVNLAMGSNVKGTVSCNLKDVTARSVLQSLLFANGFAFVEQEGIFVVVPAEKRGKEGPPGVPPAKMVRKLFNIPYTGKEPDIAASSGGIEQAATGAAVAVAAGQRGTVEVAQVIRGMLSPEGKMAYYERQHMILIMDQEEVVALVEEFVNALWAMPIQVFIDSKLVEITLQSGEAMGINWTMFQKVGESGTGLNLGSTSGIDHPGTSLVSSGTDNSGLPNVSPFTFGVVNAHIEAVARALKSRERVDLQSNPRLLVMNHRKATIIVGEEIPYLSSTESGTTNPVNTYEFKEVAVRLEVTPHVSDDGRIFMDVHPQVKNLLGYQGDPPQPVLSTREAVTYVAVEDNETLLIGGLVQRSINKSRWQVPFIARIPLIGLLFRQKQDTDGKNDLVFLLNPRLVKPGMIEGEMEAKAGLLVEPPKHDGEWKPGYPK